MFSQPVIISQAHDVKAFNCGRVALNEFLIKYALGNTTAGLARTFVTTLVDQPAVIGYFSIAAGSVERDAAPERIAKGTPQHPIPIALLARLAVDVAYQGQGIGDGLLKHALLKILEASRIIGIRAVVVHAKDQEAVNFYTQYGFIPSPLDAFHMMLILKDVSKIVTPT